MNLSDEEYSNVEDTQFYHWNVWESLTATFGIDIQAVQIWKENWVRDRNSGYLTQKGESFTYTIFSKSHELRFAFPFKNV